MLRAIAKITHDMEDMYRANVTSFSATSPLFHPSLSSSYMMIELPKWTILINEHMISITSNLRVHSFT